LRCDPASPVRAHMEYELPRPSLDSELRLACLSGTAAEELQAVKRLRQELAYKDDTLTGLQSALRARWAAHEVWRQEPLPCETAEQATRERTALEAAEGQIAQSMQILVGATNSSKNTASHAYEARNFVEEQLVMLQREHEARTALQNWEEPERFVEQPRSVPHAQEEQASVASEYKKREATAKELELLVTIKAMQKQILEVRQEFHSLKQTEQRRALEDGIQRTDTQGLRDSSVQSQLDSEDSASQKTDKGGGYWSKDCSVAACAAAGVSRIEGLPRASTMVVAPAEHARRQCRPLEVQHVEAPAMRTPRGKRTPLSPGTGNISLWAPTVLVGPLAPSPNSPCRPVAGTVQCTSITGTRREPQATYAGTVHTCVSRSHSPPYCGIPSTPRTPATSQVRSLNCGSGSRTTPSRHTKASPRNLARAGSAFGHVRLLATSCGSL